MSEPEVRIEQYCDGWTLHYKGKSYRWNHNDEDMGTEALEKFCKALGLTVEVEECY